MALVSGTRLGVYEIHAPIGEGGMGQVYRATDTALGRDVAIKILPRDFTADAQRLAWFEREARLLAALNHPHIGAIYGVVDADGARGLVLELVEGPTLAERLARGRMPIEEALSVAPGASAGGPAEPGHSGDRELDGEAEVIYRCHLRFTLRLARALIQDA